MNSEVFEGKWKQIQGSIKSNWGKLTDDDLKVIDGKIDRFVGRVQEIYGDAKEAIHERLDMMGDDRGKTTKSK